MLSVKLSNSSEKFISKCEKEMQERILKKIRSLKENPFPGECRRVQGKEEKVFRVRIGKYRILYEIIDEENLIIISNIGKRENVYE